MRVVCVFELACATLCAALTLHACSDDPEHRSSDDDGGSFDDAGGASGGGSSERGVGGTEEGGGGQTLEAFSSCVPGLSLCGAAQTCYQSGGTVGLCFESCTGQGTCPAGEECGVAAQGGGVCVPHCGGDGSCPSPLACSEGPSGLCLPSCQLLDGLCKPYQTCVGDYSCLTPEGAPRGTACHKYYGVTQLDLAVDWAKSVGELTLAEREALCDWAATRYGDYNCETTCGAGITISFSGSRAECAADFDIPGCAATVSQVHSCLVVDSDDVCELAIADAPECAPLRECM